MNEALLAQQDQLASQEDLDLRVPLDLLVKRVHQERKALKVQLVEMEFKVL